MGVASAEAAQDLHPREWAARQTALTNAQHRALNAVVQAYTPFQLQYGEFYIVESFVQPYLSIAYRTFRNYLSALNKLGVLELIWRAPNQHGDKSVWRMRLDVVLSAGQMALPIEEDGSRVSRNLLRAMNSARNGKRRCRWKSSRRGRRRMTSRCAQSLRKRRDRVGDIWGRRRLSR